MSASPLVTIVLLAFKENEFMLKRAMDSLLNQSLREIKILIMLDFPGNTDAIKLFKDYELQDSRVKLHVNEVNLGMSHNRNKAIELCDTPYLMWQDADDYSHIDRAKHLVDYMQSNQEVTIVGTNIQYIKEGEKGYSFLRKYPENGNKFIHLYSPLAHPSIIIRTSAFEKYGFYTEDFVCAEDYDLWWSWHKQGAIIRNINYLGIDYYQNEGQVKSTKTKLQLRNTVKVKLHNYSISAFGIKGSIRLGLESLALLLPSSVILYLFYTLTSLKTKMG